VLAGKGPLRRARNRRALACSAPFWRTWRCDGRLRREHDRARNPFKQTRRKRTRWIGAYRTSGLHFYLIQPRAVWVTSLNELTGRHGKTVTEALPTPSAVRKAEQEVAEFRKYQRLGRELVELSEQICRARPVEDTLSAQEKKRRKPLGRKSNGK
jgi:hypothetical protein